MALNDSLDVTDDDNEVSIFINLKLINIAKIDTKLVFCDLSCLIS